MGKGRVGNGRIGMGKGRVGNGGIGMGKGRVGNGKGEGWEWEDRNGKERLG